MKKKITTIAVAAIISVTAAFNAMAATAEEKTDPVVAVATEKKETKKIIKVKLNKDVVKKATGKKFRLKADVNHEGYKAKFYSTNKKVAVVDKNGVVKTKKAGTANIVANCNGVKDTCKVKVVQQCNSITNSTMTSIESKVGCQVDRVYYSPTIMCSAYSFAYAYKQVTGKYITPGSVWSYGGCTWTGGTYKRYSSRTDMLSTIKNEIDNNRACVGYLATRNGPHYVTFYSYTGDGADMSDYAVLDPWDGEIKNASEFGIYGYHVVTINK